MRQEPSRNVWPPEPGFFKMRLRSGCWQVPCAIYTKESEGLIWWRVEIDGALSLWDPDPLIAQCDRVWHYGERIDEDEFRRLNTLRRTAPADHPARNPLKRADPRLLPPILTHTRNQQ